MKPTSPPNSQKAVLVISSHVVRGSVGNRAAAFALEVLGHPVWTLPTVTLPWHPGQGTGTRIIASEKDFADLCNDLANAKWNVEIAGVISGFMANAHQTQIVANLISRLKDQNADLVYLCDPVIGDFSARPQSGASSQAAQYGETGSLYVAGDTALAIRNSLLPLADIATPNLFELGWLADETAIGSQAQLLRVAQSTMAHYTIENLLVTSVPALMRGAIGTILISPDQAMMSEHKAIPNPPNGLGDLTSALFISHKLHGQSGEKNLEKTTASVFEVLARTHQQGADELMLESNIISLSRPMALVNMRRLKLPDKSGSLPV